MVERLRTLRSAIDWSYNLLSPDLQRSIAYEAVSHHAGDAARCEHHHQSRDERLQPHYRDFHGFFHDKLGVHSRTELVARLNAMSE